MGRTWGRLYAGTRKHRKICLLREAHPNSWWLWYPLIEMALEVDDEGWIYVSPDRPFTEKELARELGLPSIRTLNSTLTTMERLELVELDGRYVKVKDYLARQFESDESKFRVRKWRERKKKQESGDVTVTLPGDVTVTPITEQNRTYINPPIIPPKRGDVPGSLSCVFCGVENGSNKMFKVKAHLLNPHKGNIPENTVLACQVCAELQGKTPFEKSEDAANYVHRKLYYKSFKRFDPYKPFMFKGSPPPDYIAKTSFPPYSADFERFWSRYPNLAGGKEEAWKEWLARIDSGTLPPIDELMDRLEVLIECNAAWKEDGGKWIPWAKSFIKKGRWTDADQFMRGKKAILKAPNPECPDCKGEGVIVEEVDGKKKRYYCKCRTIKCYPTA